MNVRLSKIQNWPDLALRARWSVSKLGELCGVSERTIERYFQKNRQMTPKEWLNELRHSHAIKRLKNGESVKRTSSELGYRNPETFCHEFKKIHGKCPSEWVKMSGIDSNPKIVGKSYELSEKDR